MKIEEVMVRDVLSVTEDTSVGEVAKLLSEHNISGLPVVDESGAVCGVVSEADLLPKFEGLPFTKIRLTTLVGEELGNQDLKSAFDKARSLAVSEIMQKNSISIEPDKDLKEAAIVLSQNRLKRLPVVDADGELVGIITRSDIVRAISSE